MSKSGGFVYKFFAKSENFSVSATDGVKKRLDKTTCAAGAGTAYSP